MNELQILKMIGRQINDRLAWGGKIYATVGIYTKWSNDRKLL